MTAKDPRTTEEIYQDIKDRLTDRIPKLTNFVQSSFNYVFTRAFASSQHDLETAATAVQLSGWADYVGKEITEDDLDELDVDGATPEEINRFVNDQQIEEFAKAFGVSRDPAVAATGEVEITTNSATTIPEGTVFGTQPDSTGDFVRFETTETVSTSGAATITSNIQAVEAGEAGNVGTGTITYLPSPPTGVDAVTNTSPTSGGINEQSNDEFREDIKNAIVESSEGGTTDGLETYIENNTQATSAKVDEKFTGDTAHGSYPHGDVIVNGGTDQEIEDAIDFAHPSGVEHILVRPDIIETDVILEVEGNNINTAEVEDNISEYFASLGIEEDVFRDQVIQAAMNADPDILNLSSLDIRVVNEAIEFQSGTNVYQLNKTLENDDEDGEGITEVTGTLSGSSNTFVEDTDYQEFNSVAGDTSNPQDSIDWSLAGDNPDDTTDFLVDYNVKEDIMIGTSEVIQLNTVTVTVV